MRTGFSRPDRVKGESEFRMTFFLFFSYLFYESSIWNGRNSYPQLKHSDAGSNQAEESSAGLATGTVLITKSQRARFQTEL